MALKSRGPGFTVLLQVEGFSSPLTTGKCCEYEVNGVASPVQIQVVACDPAAIPAARTLFAELDLRLRALGGSRAHCGGPALLGCRAWQTPGCRHVLVLLIGAAPLDVRFENLARTWISNSPTHTSVIPALLPAVSASQAFAGSAFPTLSKCAFAVWGGAAGRLADAVLADAVLESRPGVFVSYVRKEAQAGADQIHDALVRAGYRVFLDRFSGTAGRIFPDELAEAMADMGLVLLLETRGIQGSPWTMWEVMFARRYRLGPVAVNFGGPSLPGVATRTRCSGRPSRRLLPADVSGVVDFVRDNTLAVAAGRRAYYETLVRLAARAKKATVLPASGGILEISARSGRRRAYVLPAGVPGRLGHIRRLVTHVGKGARILGSQHRHLPPGLRSDLEWIAAREQVALAHPASLYREVVSSL